LGFRSYLDKDAIEEKWGADIADKLQYQRQSVSSNKEEQHDEDTDGPWNKAIIWELWDKVKRKVIWLSPGYDRIIETKDDFLKLFGFFPCPPFFIANPTTSLYIPTSDFHLAQDLYNEIDILQSRISIITSAVKVVGAYDAAASDLKRIFQEGKDNLLFPVNNWALFAEKGGIKGSIDWVPMKDIVETLEKLRGIRDETIGLLQQVTGMSDIMRGELGGQYEGVGQSQLKVMFGSVRLQSLQEEFATFVSNIMKIRAEIIGLHYEENTIAKIANTSSFMKEDIELIPEAIKLLKNPKEAKLHIVIRPESIAMIDYAQVQGERSSYLETLSTYVKAITPMLKEEPSTAPFLLQLLQWGLAGQRGAGEIEGVLDKAIQVATEASKNPADKPDLAKQAAQLEQMKQQAAMALEQLKHKNNVEEIQSKAQSDNFERSAELEADLTTIKAELKADLLEIAAKMQADIKTELLTSRINAEQAASSSANEIEKDVISSALAIEVDKAKQKSSLENKNE